MRFGVLGPVTVADGEGPLPVAAPLVRSLLGVLLVEAGRSVGEERLIEALWGGAPPASAKASLHNTVLRLRRRLGSPESGRIRRTLEGYLIEVGPGELDLHEFERLRRTGAAHLDAGRWRAAADDLAGAAALWRGTPLADALPAVRDVVRLDHLAEDRIQTVELLVRAWLRLGRYDQVVSTLGPLALEHPWRENLHGHLMHALHGVGRRADALAVYQELRSNLVEELGIEPSATVAELHRRILAGDPALTEIAEPPGPAAADAPVAVARDAAAARTAVRTGGPPADVAPRQLPPRARHFTGRRPILAAMTGLLDAGDAPLVAIVGTAGVGKTALAVRWAGDVAERYPDGCLYVDLRGFEPGGGPGTAPEQALHGFLHALGVPPGDLPSELASLAGLFRSVTAGRRLIVVLDNVRDPEHVRPLLCGAPGCLTIVTSRDRLTGLVAVDGASLVSLDLLSTTEAVALLTRRMGPGQASSSPRATAELAELAELCARLPLALNIAAARLATSPHLRPAGLASLLRGDQRLSELDAHDPSASVRAVFSWSYRLLSPAAARLFRLLGLHPGPDIAAAAAASLAGLPVSRVRILLAELVGAHLVAEHAPDRFAFHDLLRVYAVEQALAGEDAGERAAAMLRTLDHYLHTARVAVLLLSPNQMPIDAAPPAPGTSPEDLGDAAQATAWFAAGKEVLTAAVAAAAETGHDPHVWGLAWALVPYLTLQGHHDDLVTVLHAALASADRAADPVAQSRTHRLLAQIYPQRGRLDLALVHAEEALASSVALGDPLAEAGSSRALAFVLERMGDRPGALRHVERAHELFAAAGHRPGQAWALDEAAYVLIRLDRHAEALIRSERALALFGELDDRFGMAAAWSNIGAVQTWLGDHERAVDCHRRSAELFEELGARERGAGALSKLGDAWETVGDLAAARDSWERALAVYEEVGHPDAAAVRVKLAGAASGGFTRSSAA